MAYNRIKKLVTFIFKIAGYEVLEVMNSAVLLLGAAAILRWDNDIFSAGVTYRVIAQYMPENALGFLFLSLGLLKIVALLDGGLRFRHTVSVVITVFWSILFMFFLIGNPTGMFYLWIGLFAIISTIIAARLKVDRDNHIPSWTARV